MEMRLSTCLTAALLFGAGQAHKYLKSPMALSSRYNPASVESDIDYDISGPLAENGSNYPCKGAHKLLGTPSGAPVEDWTAGESYEIIWDGVELHDGGSCQAALSLDGGETFKVIHSWQGSCPQDGDVPFKFRIPSDVPATKNALLAATWFNTGGKREFYMNCASINIAGGSGGGGSEKTKFMDRPEPFQANIGNGCKTVWGVDLKFPNPGPDVDTVEGRLGDPEGDCEVPKGGAAGTSGSGNSTS